MRWIASARMNLVVIALGVCLGVLVVAVYHHICYIENQLSMAKSELHQAKRKINELEAIDKDLLQLVDEQAGKILATQK